MTWQPDKNNSEQYEKSKEQKRGEKWLMHTEEFSNTEDPKSMARWIEAEIDDFAPDRPEDTGKLLEQIVESLTNRLGVDKKILGEIMSSEYERDNDLDRYGENFRYHVYFCGCEICTVEGNTDWTGGYIHWFHENLEETCRLFLHRVKEFKETGEW